MCDIMETLEIDLCVASIGVRIQKHVLDWQQSPDSNPVLTAAPAVHDQGG